MFNLKKVSLVVVGSLVTAFYVSANEPVNTATEASNVDLTQLLSQYDKDGNGLLSKAEVAASKHKILLENFDDIDTNNDETLSHSELSSFKLDN